MRRRPQPTTWNRVRFCGINDSPRRFLPISKGAEDIAMAIGGPDGATEEDLSEQLPPVVDADYVVVEGDLVRLGMAARGHGASPGLRACDTRASVIAG